jgi:hypothetical protein
MRETFLALLLLLIGVFWGDLSGSKGKSPMESLETFNERARSVSARLEPYRIRPIKSKGL